MRLIAGEVSAEKFAQFNMIRFSLITRNPEDSKYIEKKGWFVRTSVDMFVHNPKAFMSLARAADHEKRRNREVNHE